MRIIGILSTVIIFSSCNAFENENPNLLAFQGTWELHFFSGGIGGWSTDMDTVDYKISLVAIGEKAEWYIDDEVEVKYNIKPTSEYGVLLKLTPIETNKDVFSLPRYLYAIENDEASIADGCNDCYNYIFAKKKD